MASLADTVMGEKKEREGDNLAKSILMEARTYWENMDNLRKEYYRCKRYVDGDQWSDEIEFQGQRMTEKAAIEKQGRYPVTNNLLKILIRNYKGTYIKQDLEPVCQARDNEEQYLSDALSTALQYNWDINSQKELNADIFEDALCSGFLGAKLSTGIYNNRYDVWSEVVELPRFIVNTNARDPRGMDVELVGEIHDMTRNTLLATYAKSASDRKRISDIYKMCCNKEYVSKQYSKFGQIKTTDDFLFPNEYGLCRVIEVWKKEHRDGYWCHDYLTGELYGIKSDELAEIEQLNELRLKQAHEAGIPFDEIEEAKTAGQSFSGSVKLIRTDYFYEDYWYYRFLSPNGEVIDEGETPYSHKSHPYVFRFYPMMGGTTRSFISDVIDLQRDINRGYTMYDWIMRHSAKGALLFPEDQLADGWNLQMYGNAWAKPDAVIPYRPKAGAAIPQQISKNNTDIGLIQMLADKTKKLEDVTGIQGTLQGKAALSGTSASLYAQQTANANTSILDLLNLMSAWTKDLATKQIKLMQQCYDVKKFEQIVGKSGGVSRNLDEIVNTDVDVRIIESASSPTYRQITSDKLDQLLQLGMIDVTMWLRYSTLPFKNELLEDLRMKAEQDAMAGQQQLPTAVPQQASQAAIAGANNPQAGANNLYNMMQKNNEQ